MAVDGWLVDKSASARSSQPPFGDQLAELAGRLYLCPVGELEILYSARSADDYDLRKDAMRSLFERVSAPSDILERALVLQSDLAHHHGMWHQTPIRDLLIAETALHHELGVVHVDGDYERIAEVRSLTVRRLS